MTVTRSVVLGCGSYLPERLVTNAELAKKIGLGRKPGARRGRKPKTA